MKRWFQQKQVEPIIIVYYTSAKGVTVLSASKMGISVVVQAEAK